MRLGIGEGDRAGIRSPGRRGGGEGTGGGEGEGAVAMALEATLAAAMVAQG